MSRRSKIASLPPDVRDELNRLIAAAGYGNYRAAAAWLQEQHGVDIQKSAVADYGAKLQRRIDAIQHATEQAEALVATAPDDGGAMADGSLRLVQERIFALMLEAEGGDLKELAAAARALAEVARASISVRSERRKVLAQKRADADAALARAEAEAGEGGDAMDVIRRVRREVYGMLDD